MSTVQYDFTNYAATYEYRPDYAPQVLDAVRRVTGVAPGDLACDIGAGSGHLTLPLLEYGLEVDAVEPTPAMQEIGERRTAAFTGVSWSDGQGERTGRPSDKYRLVTFGSSFDRTDQPAALRETHRLLRPGGHFMCCWNHRDFTDPLQREIEEMITSRIDGYTYGLRRTDPTDVIVASGLFEDVVHLSGTVVHEVDSDQWCAAWRSHMTLGDQAGDAFDGIIEDITTLVRSRSGDTIKVPYVTRAWVARVAEGSADGR
ncbi:MAG TPA: class I SAM-dependent methyltransferase [Actinophytocola sp.]|nr:class I SAM-dependent methyltransferase [Actinophytocola sp.]